MEERDERSIRPIVRRPPRRPLWLSLLAVLLLAGVWGMLHWLFPPGWATTAVNLTFWLASAYVVLRGSELLSHRLPGWVVLILLVLVWSLALLYVRPYVQVLAMRAFGS